MHSLVNKPGLTIFDPATLGEGTLPAPLGFTGPENKTKSSPTKL